MRTSRVISIAFGVSTLASIGLVALYAMGGNRAAEAILLGLALGALGLGIVLWARLVDSPDVTEERKPARLEPPGGVDPSAEVLTRRRLLLRLALVAGGTLAAALAVPTLSLGPQPGQSLYATKWRRGARVVDGDDQPVRPIDLPLEGVATVFPEGEVGSADSQTLLIRVEEDLLVLPEGRAEWAPEGVVAYSKVCTHAGCPVGLYRAEAHQLLCPCHQSTFDVLRGAEPVFGPAARPLPQLPLGVDDDGYLVALGDFAEPVGPSFWNLS